MCYQIVIGLTISALALSTGCNKQTPSTPNNISPDATLLKVVAIKPKQTMVGTSLELPGVVTASETTPIHAKIAGYLKEISPDKHLFDSNKFHAYVDIGSVVSKGQQLALIDVPELDAEYHQKRAMVELTRAELDLAIINVILVDSSISTALVSVREAEAGLIRTTAELNRWAAELKQVEDLIARKVVDNQSRDVIYQQYRAAESLRGESLSKVHTAAAIVSEWHCRKLLVEAQVVVAKRRVSVAQATLDEVDSRRAFAHVLAPYDGIITARNVHTGHYVQPMSANHSPPLFTVARIDRVRVVIDIPESSISRTGLQTSATIRVPALLNREFSASINRRSGTINTSSHTSQAEIDLENPEGTLKPGMYTVVTLQDSLVASLLVPTECVLSADESQYLYLVENGKAIKYTVQTGIGTNGSVAIVRRKHASIPGGTWQPFTGNEQVIFGNLGALIDGISVEVQ